MKSKVNIFLKSGHTVEVICDTWEFKLDDTGYYGYKFTGLNKGFSIGMHPSEIVGYTATQIEEVL